MTTTGFSMIAVPESLPLAGHLLRAWSQWCGGLVIAVAGLAFLMDRGPGAKMLGFADFGEEAMASSVRTHARSLLMAYGAMTLAGMAAALFLVPGYTEGPLLALAAISTGGMAPRGDSLASYSFAAQALLVGLGTLGAVSLAFPVLAARQGLRSAATSTAVRLLVVAVLLGLAVATGLMLLSGITDPRAIGEALLNLLSVQSTTGFSTGPLPGVPTLLVLMIVVMAVGGQTGSTAGGMKVERMRIMLGAISVTLQRLRSPANAVLHLRLRSGEVVSAERVHFAVALVAVYILSVFVLWTAFTLHGLPAADSLFDVVSALSTVGAGTGVIGPDLTDDLKLLTVLAMLLGRVEFFGLLILALPQTWQRRD